MIKEIDVIRTTVPLRGANVYGGTQLFDFPAGSKGAVVHVFGNSEAFEVEFLVFDDPADPEHFIPVILTVEANQCELDWQAPA